MAEVLDKLRVSSVCFGVSAVCREQAVQCATIVVLKVFSGGACGRGSVSSMPVVVERRGL